MIIDKLFEIARLLSEKMEKENFTLSAAKKETKRIVSEKMKPAIGRYFLQIIFLFLATWLVPLAFLVPGIIYNSTNLIILGGILRTILTLFMLSFAAPLGIMLEIIFRGFQGSGERYVKLISAIFVTELFFTLIACFVPFANKADLIAPFILTAVILGSLNAWFFQPKIIARVTGIIFVGILISFFIPQMPFVSVKLGYFITKMGKNVSGPKLIMKSCSELRTTGILWSADGSNKYWYHRDKKSNQIRLYDGKGNDIIDGMSLLPFKSEALSEYCKQEENAKIETAEKVRKAQAAKKSILASNTNVMNWEYVGKMDIRNKQSPSKFSSYLGEKSKNLSGKLIKIIRDGSNVDSSIPIPGLYIHLPGKGNLLLKEKNEFLCAPAVCGIGSTKWTGTIHLYEKNIFALINANKNVGFIASKRWKKSGNGKITILTTKFPCNLGVLGSEFLPDGKTFRAVQKEDSPDSDKIIPGLYAKFLDKYNNPINKKLSTKEFTLDIPGLKLCAIGSTKWTGTIHLYEKKN